MLSYIKWFIKHIELNSVIILTDSWVWYEIIINELTYSKIYDKDNIELFLFHNITENGQTLFWFIDIEERVFFKELIKISWIGWRVAQTILSLWLSRLKTAILEDDKKTLESIKWVWKKMVEKIVLELSDKDIVKNYFIPSQDKNTKKVEDLNLNSDLKKEIISTLTIMWYNPKRVEEILKSLPYWFDDAQKIIPYVIKNI
jgi:holliday junction DNA helicase RuvA